MALAAARYTILASELAADKPAPPFERIVLKATLGRHSSAEERPRMAPRKSKKNSVPQLQASDFVHLPDLAVILEQLATPLLDEDDDKALDKAKETFYKACEAPSKKKRIALAKKA